MNATNKTTPVLVYNEKTNKLYSTSSDGESLVLLATVESRMPLFYGAVMTPYGADIKLGPDTRMFLNTHDYIYKMGFSKSDDSDYYTMYIRYWEYGPNPKNIKTIKIAVSSKDDIGGIVNSVSMINSDRVSVNKTVFNAYHSRLDAIMESICENVLDHLTAAVSEIGYDEYKDNKPDPNNWVAMTYDYKTGTLIRRIARKACITADEADISPFSVLAGDRDAIDVTQHISQKEWDSVFEVYDTHTLRVNETITVLNHNKYNFSVAIADDYSSVEFLAYELVKETVNIYPATNPVHFAIPTDSTPWKRIARAVDYLVASSSGAVTYMVKPHKVNS